MTTEKELNEILNRILRKDAEGYGAGQIAPTPAQTSAPTMGAQAPAMGAAPQPALGTATSAPRMQEETETEEVYDPRTQDSGTPRNQPARLATRREEDDETEEAKREEEVEALKA